MGKAASSSKQPRATLSWFLKGASNVVSLPALILIMSFIGFGALTAEAGLTVWQAMFLGITTWALPSAVLVAGAIINDVPFYATVFAVVLASVRLLPMTMALVPMLKSDKTKLSSLLLSAYFMAVTSWVFAMNRLPEIERENRVPFFLGFALTLAMVVVITLGIAHSLVPNLPVPIAAALIFLTPVYFLLSMTAAARITSEYWAIGFGLVLGPIFHLITPDTDLLWCGLLGGTMSYGLSRLVESRKGA
ncbi:MAG: AzlC family ABC transporter permease [Hyphomicrobiales bacterium]